MLAPKPTLTMSFRKLFLIALTLLTGGIAFGQNRYSTGDIVENFTLINPATRQEVELYDLEGKVLILEWFAWWCPFCQAAAAQVETGIVDYYKDGGGNPNDVPVMHVALNMQGNAESQTQGFVNRYGFEFVLNDFNRAVANRFQTGGQPIFAIINGVKNSASHEQWELLYSLLGYNLPDNLQPIGTFRSHIDSVEAAAVDPGPVLPQEFLNYLADLGISESDRDVGQDPDYDGSPNVFEYYFGSDASDTSSFAQPTPTIVTISSTRYHALQFIRDPTAVGVEISVEFSDSPSFDSLNGSVPFSDQLLENGRQQVVVRSGLPLSGREFSRLIYRSEDS